MLAALAHELRAGPVKAVGWRRNGWGSHPA